MELRPCQQNAVNCLFQQKMSITLNYKITFSMTLLVHYLSIMLFVNKNFFLGVSATSSKHFAFVASTRRTIPKEKHIVLIGGGHAHAQVIKALNAAERPRNLRVTLIDPLKAASYSGMVPGCVAGFYTPEQTQMDLQALAEWSQITFINDRVVDMDFERKLVFLEQSENPISYDAVSIDIGSASRDLDVIPGARKYTIPTRPIHRLVERLDNELNNLEEEPPHLVVVGGGAAGIELAMAVSSRWKHARSDLKCTILDSGKEVLPQESQMVRKVFKETLLEKGICVKHNCQVKEVTDGRILLKSGDEIPFTHCIWATGAGAHPVAYHLSLRRGLAATPHGWLKVEPTLESSSHPGVFAAGDCASIQNLKRGPPPKAGVYAVRAGPILIENLVRYLDGRPLVQYDPQEDFLKLVVCGYGEALGIRFGLAMRGKWVFQLKDRIDNNFMQLFDARKLPPPKLKGSFDTSQYDANDSPEKIDTPDAKEAAEMLLRSDDDVDYHAAWAVLKRMASDIPFREAVLSNVAMPCTALAQ